MSDPEDDDGAAGEYVLGTLPLAERQALEVRRSADAGIDAAITAWEHRLAPLLEAIPDVAPPASIYESVISRLFGASVHRLDTTERERLALRRSVTRWRSAFAAAAALAAALVVWIVVAPPRLTEQNFVAVLQKDANSTAVLLDIDLATRKLTIRPVAANNPPDRNMELWLINGSSAPRSLGTLSERGVTRASLSGFDASTIENATYAVTLEPVGGSPNGAPSGPPILLGHIAPETH